MTTQIRTRQVADANITLAKLASDVRLDTITAPSGSVGLNSQKITSLATPTASGDAVNKSYVDERVNGSDWKASVRMATAGNVADLAAAVVADIDGEGQGVTLVEGNRVLLAAQTDASKNGIYVVGTVASGEAPLTRSEDANTSAEVTNGMTCPVSEGDYAGFNGRLVTADPIVLDTTDLVFDLVPSVVTAGNGLTLTGTTLSVNVDNSTIEISSDSLRVKDLGITTAKIAAANVTLAKIANAAASSKLVGSGASGSGVSYAEITLGTGLSMSGTTLNVEASSSATKAPARLATTTTLGGYTYDNGASGVGATITLASTGVLTIDGSTVALNDRVVIKDETSDNRVYNGIYKCTTAGAVGVAAVLTRAIDSDTGAELAGAIILVESGSSNAATEWGIAIGTVVVETTNIIFTRLSPTSAINFSNANEIPSGSINGSNVTFVLAQTPTANSLNLLLNGIGISVANGDYTISSATITMTTAPLTGESLAVGGSYRY